MHDALVEPCDEIPPSSAGGTVALYAQLCRAMGFSPFGTLKLQDHQQILALKSGEGGERGDMVDMKGLELSASKTTPCIKTA